MFNANQLLQTLEDNPRVHVSQGIVLPRLKEQALHNIEQELGTELQQDIRSFYLAHNGVSIQWVYKGKPDFDVHDYPRNDSEFPYLTDFLQNYGPPVDGQLVLLPLEDVLVKDFEARGNVADCGAHAAHLEYLQGIEAEWGKSRQSSSSKLRFFEVFLRDSITALSYAPGQPDPEVYFIGSRWRGIDPRLKLPFSTYLKHITQDFGFRWGRHHYFEGSKAPQDQLSPAQRLEAILDLC